MTNVIIGTDKGKFTVNLRRNGKRGVRTDYERKFAADDPKAAVDYLKLVAGRENIGAMMNSSSMDFPEEYGVTREQVAAFDVEFEKEFGKE